MVGFLCIGVSLVWIVFGKEFFVYYLYYWEEEWIYVLLGCVEVCIDGEIYIFELGDFVVFFMLFVVYQMVNLFEEEFVYLMGGESKEVEIVDFFDFDKCMICCGFEIEIYRFFDVKLFGFDEE